MGEGGSEGEDAGMADTRGGDAGDAGVAGVEGVAGVARVVLLVSDGAALPAAARAAAMAWDRGDVLWLLTVNEIVFLINAGLCHPAAFS